MARTVSSILLVALAACGSARMIRTTANGGVIELQGDRSKAMEQATSDMNQKCGRNNFTIVQDGEEPVINDSITPETQQDQSQAASTGAAAPTETSSRQVMAWRIHFECSGAAGGPLPPPVLGPPAPGGS